MGIIKIIPKEELKNNYYYSGYMHQNFCAIDTDLAPIVGVWDGNRDRFLFFDYDNERRTKRKIKHMSDIDHMDEISEGFVPIKEMMLAENLN